MKAAGKTAPTTRLWNSRVKELTKDVAAYSATLADNVENLYAVDFSGNWSTYTPGDDLRRTFIGNSLNNIIDTTALSPIKTYYAYGMWIDGGAGSDVMIGGGRNDTYVVDDPNDAVIETADALDASGNQFSIDTVRSSVSYTLSANLENLTLTGSASVNGTGNISNNVMDGSTNTAANVLAGGLGDPGGRSNSPTPGRVKLLHPLN